MLGNHPGLPMSYLRPHQSDCGANSETTNEASEPAIDAREKGDSRSSTSENRDQDTFNDDDSPLPAYSSYAEYIGDLSKTWKQYKDLYHILTDMDATIGAFRMLIADSGPDRIKQTSFKSDPSGILPNSIVKVDEDLNTRILRALKVPPDEDTQARIIVLEIFKNNQISSRKIIDAIGMQYDIDPAIFDAFLRFSQRDRDTGDEAEACGAMPRVTNFLRLHGRMIGLAFHQIRSSGKPFKTVLVMSYATEWDDYVHAIVYDEPPSIHRKHQEPVSLRSTCASGEAEDCGWFTAIYEQRLAQLQTTDLDLFNCYPLEFVYPWVEWWMQDIISWTRWLRARIIKTGGDLKWGEYIDDPFGESTLANVSIIKRELSGAQELQRVIQKHIKMGDEVARKSLLDLNDMIEATIRDANGLLDIIADLKHTAIGSMAIKESRRTIEEAVSVRRLTQLAFVFVPLNYVSSVFGMNVDELSGNGPRLWKFLATSFALLVGALSFWVLGSSMQKWWASRMKYRRLEEIMLKKRIEMIYAGARTGNFTWMLRSGVLLSLATGNRFGSKNGTGKAYEKFWKDWKARAVATPEP